MKKKIFTGLITVALAAVLAVPAFAAISDSQKKEINDIYGQIAELRKQVVDKYVDAGEITKEEAQAIKENIDQAAVYQEGLGGFAGPGVGCGGGAGAGNGMMSGYGMMGGNGMMGAGANLI